MRTGVMLTVAMWLITPGSLLSQPAASDPKSVEYLRRCLLNDGGYAAKYDTSGSKLPSSSLRATNGALRAIKYLGGNPEHMDETVRFVERCFDSKTGGFGDAPGQPPTVFSTAVGVMTAAELKLPPGRFGPLATKFLTERTKGLEEIRIAAAAFEALGVRPGKADDWLKEIAASRNPDGTFGSGTGRARATGGTAAMILRLGGTLDHRDAILKAMRDGQRPDGGFGTAERTESDLESSYRVVRAFAMMNEKPADPTKMRAFIARCRHSDGGYAERPGEPPTVAGTYFASINLHWLDKR